MTSLNKTVAAVLAASILAAAAPSAPAAAHEWHHGFGGAGLAAGIVGGLVLGAIVANAASPDCGYVNQPVYDQWGHFRGYRAVPAC